MQMSRTQSPICTIWEGISPRLTIYPSPLIMDSDKANHCGRTKKCRVCQVASSGTRTVRLPPTNNKIESFPTNRGSRLLLRRIRIETRQSLSSSFSVNPKTLFLLFGPETQRCHCQISIYLGYSFSDGVQTAKT